MVCSSSCFSCSILVSSLKGSFSINLVYKQRLPKHQASIEEDKAWKLWKYFISWGKATNGIKQNRGWFLKVIILLKIGQVKYWIKSSSKPPEVGYNNCAIIIGTFGSHRSQHGLACQSELIQTLILKEIHIGKCLYSEAMWCAYKVSCKFILLLFICQLNKAVQTEQ